jgi:hypothetical protein
MRRAFRELAAWRFQVVVQLCYPDQNRLTLRGAVDDNRC